MYSTGKRIQARRKALGLTVDELAAKLGKNRATIYRYESDEIENLPITIIRPLADALDTTPAYLMGWESEVPVPVVMNEDRNIIRIAGRDGSYVVKSVTDEQLQAFKTMLNALPSIDDDLI